MGINHRGYDGNNFKGFKPKYFVVPSTVPNKKPTEKRTLKMLGVWRETLI